jgi:hypothetical protein
MDELIAFLKARLDEDEAMARDLLRAHPGPWRIDLPSDVRDSTGKVVVADEYHWDPMPHIARYDPAWALRDVAAKRAIIAEYEEFNGEYEWQSALSFAIVRLAAAWDDHPDYLPEWASARG